jgi:hypothetical protein
MTDATTGNYQAKELMQNGERLSKELGDKNSLGKPQ